MINGSPAFAIVIVCGELKSDENVIIPPDAGAAAIASRSEQSSVSQLPSLVSAVLLTIKINADGSASVQSENELTPVIDAVFAAVLMLPPGCVNTPPLYF